MGTSIFYIHECMNVSRNSFSTNDLSRANKKYVETRKTLGHPDRELQNKLKGLQPSLELTKADTQLSSSFCKFQQFYSLASSRFSPIFHLVWAPAECSSTWGLSTTRTGWLTWTVGCLTEIALTSPQTVSCKSRIFTLDTCNCAPGKSHSEFNPGETRLMHKHYTRLQSSCPFFFFLRQTKTCRLEPDDSNIL